MAESKNKSENAERQLVALLDSHFAHLLPKERVVREKAFSKAVAKIGSRLATPAASPLVLSQSAQRQ